MLRMKMLALINGKNNYLEVLEENKMYDAIAVSFHWSCQIYPEQTNWSLMQRIFLGLMGNNNKICIIPNTINTTYAVTCVVISGYVVDVTIH